MKIGGGVGVGGVDYGGGDYGGRGEGGGVGSGGGDGGGSLGVAFGNFQKNRPFWYRQSVTLPLIYL